MPSPFPGMDPFLEGQKFFPDLHSSFQVYLRELLQAKLPAPYFAVVSERLFVEVEDQYGRPIKPDTDALVSADYADDGGGVAVATSFRTRSEPIILTKTGAEPESQKLVEIRTRETDGSERIVTTVEVLSRSNKQAGTIGRELYEKKQREVLRGGIHLVEIDLLRSGKHTTAVPKLALKKKAPQADYHVCVSVIRRPLQYLLYPFRIEETLPEIAVPLLAKDGFVPLDLQVVFQRCYDAGPYPRRVRYELPLVDPPLNPPQQEWAEKLLREKNEKEHVAAGASPEITTPSI